jgi:predicted ThiF/HesA family dinucleotide-utilizing enzyme
MIHVLVMLIKYRKSIELTGRDELFDLLDSISEIGSVVSNTLENFKMNIKLQNSFLVSGQVAVCSLCGVPMPAEIAVIGESKETIVKTIKIDNSGFVEILENAFRKIPAFASGSLEEVSENLRKLTEVMISVTIR